MAVDMWVTREAPSESVTCDVATVRSALDKMCVLICLQTPTTITKVQETRTPKEGSGGWAMGMT